MTTEQFDDWIESLEDRALAGFTAEVQEELNAAETDGLDHHQVGRMSGLAICCLEWSGLDPLAKGLADELCEGDPAVALSAGIECSELDELEHAQAMFRALCERCPDSVYPPMNLGVVLQKLGEPMQAVSCFDQVLELEPEFAPAMLERARSLDGLGEYEAASSAYRAYLDREPGDAWEWVSLGIVESEREEFGSALEAYDRARRVDPACLSAHYNFGVTAARMEDPALLDSAADAIREHDPGDCRLFLLEAYQVESESPDAAWNSAMTAIVAAEGAEDFDLYEHSIEVLLSIGERNGMEDRCDAYINDAYATRSVVAPVLDAERRLHGAIAEAASLWLMRVEVEITDADAIAELTGDEPYDGPGFGYFRAYRVWATSKEEAEELATSCERRAGFGRVVGIVGTERLEGAIEEHVGVEWRSEMHSFELDAEH